MIDLCGGIQVDLKLAFHETADGLFEFGRAVVHVPAILGTIDLDGHLLPDFAVRHGIVFTDSKIEQSAIGIIS